MNKFIGISIGIVLFMVCISGCLGGNDDDIISPDDLLYVNSGANGMSSTKIDLADFMDFGHMQVIITLDKTESIEEHVIYLYLFEGAEPPTSTVGLDGIQAALEADSFRSYAHYHPPQVPLVFFIEKVIGVRYDATCDDTASNRYNKCNHRLFKHSIFVHHTPHPPHSRSRRYACSDFTVMPCPIAASIPATVATIASADVIYGILCFIAAFRM